MFTRSGSIHIDAPAETVFDYVADLARHPEWAAQPMTVKVEGPLAVGTRYTSDVQFMGHPQGRGQILEVDTPRRFAFDATDSSGHYKWFFNIRPEGSGVNLEYGFDRLAAPLPFTLLQGLVFWPMFGSKWTAQSLAKIKAICEATAKAASA